MYNENAKLKNEFPPNINLRAKPLKGKYNNIDPEESKSSTNFN